MSMNQQIASRVNWFLDFLDSKENKVHTEVFFEKFAFRFKPKQDVSELEVLKGTEWIPVKRAPIEFRAAVLKYALEINQAIDAKYRNLPVFIQEAIATFDEIKSSLENSSEISLDSI